MARGPESPQKRRKRTKVFINTTCFPVLAPSTHRLSTTHPSIIHTSPTYPLCFITCPPSITSPPTTVSLVFITKASAMNSGD